MTLTGLSWRQTVRHMASKTMSCRQNICHDIKSFVMTSKIRQIKSKIRHDVKTFVMTSKHSSWLQKVKKFVMISKTRHDVKKIVMTSKTCHDVNKLVITSKTRHDVKKKSSWRLIYFWTNFTFLRCVVPSYQRLWVFHKFGDFNIRPNSVISLDNVGIIPIYVHV